MKNLKNEPGKQIRLFLALCTVFFYLAAVIAPDRGAMFSGLHDILFSPAQVTKDYFIIGSVSGTFLNMALVATVCLAMLFLPGVVVKGSTIAAFILTMGFTTWGINILNIWPFFLGVLLQALVKRESFTKYVDLAMFSTGLCPIVTEMLLRYPGDTVHAITLSSVLLALGVGTFVGFMTPALAAHSPNVHKGFDLYSAALPAGMLGFFLVATLYKTAGYTVPPIEAVLGESRVDVLLWFTVLIFVLSVIGGFFLNGKSFKGYLSLLKDSGHKVDFTAKYGVGLTIMNLGIYGLFIVAYYALVGASFNGVNIGLIFCMVCFGAAGSHPGNVWPIMLGYVIASRFGVNPVNAQAIVVGLCYASGLAPVVGVYGWWAGSIAAVAHYCLVTSVPMLHGGFCLYNGGFTAALIALIFVPQLEAFCKTKEQRREARLAAKK